MPAGAYPAARPYPAGHPRRARLPYACRPASRVEAYLSQPGLCHSRCQHFIHNPRYSPRGVVLPSASGFRRNAIVCRRACGNACAPTARRWQRHFLPSGSGHHTARTLFIGLETPIGSISPDVRNSFSGGGVFPSHFQKTASTHWRFVQRSWSSTKHRCSTRARACPASRTTG